MESEESNSKQEKIKGNNSESTLLSTKNDSETPLADSDYSEVFNKSSQETEELEDYLSNQVKLRWSRVFIVGLVIGIVLIGINLIIIWVVNIYYPVFYLATPWFFFIETGVLFIWGSCLGTMKQSFTIDRIKNRLFKGETITGADTKIAIGSAYTYILAGVILAIASLVSWLIVR